MLKKGFTSSLRKNQKGNQAFPSTRILPNSSKGLSTIVATLIIILLVLVAIGIIWVVVKNIIQKGAEGIELGKFTLDLKIKGAQIGDGNVTVVVVRRNPGEGNFTGMNFIFSDGTNSETIRENTVLQELEERSFTFALTEISTDNLKTISVAPIFELSSGKESIGDIADSYEIKAGTGTGATVAEGPFAAMGFTGMGTVNYSISSGGGNLPEFKRAIVDPLDVLPGHNQTFTVHVYSPYGVINVTSLTELDNSTLNLDFEKIDEFVKDNETIEIWSISWIVNDTHAIEYRTNVTAIDSEENQNSITLTWTDSCQSVINNQGGHGADRIINENCVTASGIGGLDGGSLTIEAGYIMTIPSGSAWVFNDGKSITPNGNIGVDGEIKKGNLFYHDIDGDGYAPESTMTTSTLPSLQRKIRVIDVLGDPTYSYNIDCYDGESATTNAELAHPGQTNYYTTNRGDGSFDYDCNGYQDKEWTQSGGQCPSCQWDGYMFYCEQIGYYGGLVGWEGSAPACGVSGTYVVDPGPLCSPGRGEVECGTYCYGANIEPSRTQACR